MTKKVELVFILDRSGSMCGLESDTIGGFNAMLEKQKKLEGSATVTTVLFDDRYELLHDRLDIQAVRKMDETQYYVRGCTALLDAVGSTIQKIANVQRNSAEGTRADQVIFVIITDGFENASKEYSYSKIKSMIEHEKEKYGWEFVFLGANMDAVAEGAKMGIGRERAVTYRNDSEGVELNYEVVGKAVEMMRACSSPIDGGWKKEIEENQFNRKKKNDRKR